MVLLEIPLCLMLLTASIADDIININEEVDRHLENWNQQIRATRDTYFGILGDSIGDNITFSDGFLYGLDSLARTGNCTKRLTQNSISFDYHVGLRMFLLTFSLVTVDGESMSLYLRIRNNSFHVAYTVPHQPGGPSVSEYVIDAYEVEAFENVQLGASNPKFDNRDVNEFFKTTVRAVANDILKETLDPDGTSEDDTSLPGDGEVGSFERWQFNNHFLNFISRINLHH